MIYNYAALCVDMFSILARALVLAPSSARDTPGTSHSGSRSLPPPRASGVAARHGAGNCGWEPESRLRLALKSELHDAGGGHPAAGRLCGALALGNLLVHVD